MCQKPTRGQRVFRAITNRLWCIEKITCYNHGQHTADDHFMIEHPQRPLATGIAALLLAMLACNTAPATPPTPTSPPRTQTPTPTLTPAYSPTPDLPSGWVTYRSEALAISLYHPSEWEPVPIDDHKIDLQEKQGQGWIEITILDATTMDRWGLAYTPGMPAEAIIGELGRAARENGAFEPARQIDNRSGLAAWGIQGHYDVLDDYILIAALSLADWGIIVVGHGGSDEAEWERLGPVYKQIVWSVTP